MQTSVVSLKTASFALHRKIIHPLQHRYSSLATAEQYIPLPRSKAALLQPLQAGSCRAEAVTAPLWDFRVRCCFTRNHVLVGQHTMRRDRLYKSSCWSNIASSRHEVNDLKVRVSLHVFEDAVCIIYRTAIVALLVKWHQTTSTCHFFHPAWQMQDRVRSLFHLLSGYGAIQPWGPLHQGAMSSPAPGCNQPGSLPLQ